LPGGTPCRGCLPKNDFLIFEVRSPLPHGPLFSPNPRGHPVFKLPACVEFFQRLPSCCASPPLFPMVETTVFSFPSSGFNFMTTFSISWDQRCPQSHVVLPPHHSPFCCLFPLPLLKICRLRSPNIPSPPLLSNVFFFLRSMSKIAGSSTYCVFFSPMDPLRFLSFPCHNSDLSFNSEGPPAGFFPPFLLLPLFFCATLPTFPFFSRHETPLTPPNMSPMVFFWTR